MTSTGLTVVDALGHWRLGAQSMGGNGLIVSFGEVMAMRLGRLQRQSRRGFWASAASGTCRSPPFFGGGLMPSAGPPLRQSFVRSIHAHIARPRPFARVQ